MSFYLVFTRIFVISSVYVLGRLNYSIGWIVPLLISSIYDYSRRKRDVQKAATQALSQMNERDWILPRFSNLDDLPPWVIFPDIERAEWINTILKLMWPRIKVAKILQDLQPKINEKSPLETFTFETIDLGKIVSSHSSNDQG